MCSNPQQPFTCTFCWHIIPKGRPFVLGPAARLTCDTCFRAIMNLAICWVCGELVFHADEFCENNDKDTLLKKAVSRIDSTDGGLSRQRWMALKNIFTAPTRQTQLGGDSSMDMPASPASPDIPIPTPIPLTTIKKEDEDGDKAGAEGRDENETQTIAKLHYRRSKDPKFAELECVVPLDSAIYVSILDPMNSPAFRPCPAKPLPEWMQLLPGRNCRDEERPRSILDAHFPPAAAFLRRETSPPLSRVDEIRGTKRRR
ncbi:hypothetical protein ONZ43_g5647 [Nemania bipapillata]|uniref:Uncharacterized protein n=1 Tax=Nemania bipapillata TaxID=110536 RepID=A0ACC2I815_9PEZI|nr:hypothetical protein ONZ43_g5647 [Nemania bipapillata]